MDFGPGDLLTFLLFGMRVDQFYFVLSLLTICPSYYYLSYEVAKMLAAFARLCIIVSLVLTIGYLNCLEPEQAQADVFSEAPTTVSATATTHPIAKTRVHNPVSLEIVVLSLVNAIEVVGIVAAPVLFGLGIKSLKHKRRQGIVLISLSVAVLSLALFTTGTIHWVLSSAGCSPNLFS